MIFTVFAVCGFCDFWFGLVWSAVLLLDWFGYDHPYKLNYHGHPFKNPIFIGILKSIPVQSPIFIGIPKSNLHWHLQSLTPIDIIKKPNFHWHFIKLNFHWHMPSKLNTPWHPRSNFHWHSKLNFHWPTTLKANRHSTAHIQLSPTNHWHP
jgi:hypothetical protein